MLKDHPDTAIEIDNQVIIKGLSNPAYLVIVGFATRKVIDTVRKSTSPTGKLRHVDHILVIEPRLSVFHQTIKREYIGDLLESEDIDFVVGVEAKSLLPQIQKAMTARKDKNIVQIAMKPEMVIDPFAYPFDKTGKPHPEASQVIESVKYAAKQIALSMGCASDSFNRWEQFLKNEKNLKESYMIKQLFNQFKDLPIVVAGAGPSLVDFITYYKKQNLEDKCMIIACDASLRLLLENGIRPHLVTRCERKHTNIFKGVSKDDTKGIYFAAYPWVDYRFFDLFDESFMLFRSNGLCKWANKDDNGYNPGYVDGGVSAANAGLELAYLFGAQNILVTGVDLCFIGDRSHVEGTEVEFDIEKSKPNWTKIPGNNGKQVTTIPVWVRCLGEYRTALLKHAPKGVKVYNTSLEGAYIDGMEVKAFKDLSHLFTESKKVDDRIKKVLAKPSPKRTEFYLKRKEDTIKYLKESHDRIRLLFSDVADALRIARGEEEKAVLQLNNISEPDKFYQNLGGTMSGLTQVFSNACSVIDRFKNEQYGSDMFGKIMLDICQLDLFQTENRCAGLKNTLEHDHHRLKFYAEAHLNFFTILKYYLEKLIDRLEGDFNDNSGAVPQLEG